MKWILLFAVSLLSTPQIKAQSRVSFAVAKSGHGSPLIFVPGLDCGGEVWNDAVRHFSATHTCYVLTLPGFDGQPPIDNNNILGAVVSQLADYIRENRIQKPVIVGHSLGGWIALALAAKNPDLEGGLVIEVLDDSAALPRLRHPDDQDERGRGLQVVSQVAQRWGARRAVSGKVVWCELALPHS